jgi:arsenate reductase
VDTAGLRSKTWDEFAAPKAPPMRVVITVCDSAAAETCPYWPGSPVRIHWGYADPSAAPGDDDAKRAAFEATRQAISARMLELLALPFDTLSDAELRHALTDLHDH